jgi:hypothetical protein
MNAKIRAALPSTANRTACSIDMRMGWGAQESEKSRIGLLNFEPATWNS